MILLKSLHLRYCKIWPILNFHELNERSAIDLWFIKKKKNCSSRGYWFERANCCQYLSSFHSSLRQISKFSGVLYNINLMYNMYVASDVGSLTLKRFSDENFPFLHFKACYFISEAPLWTQSLKSKSLHWLGLKNNYIQ